MPVLEPQPVEVAKMRPAHKVNRYIFLAAILIFGAFLFAALSEFFTGFLGAVMFYVLCRRRMDKLLKAGWRKPWAAIFIILLTFVIIMIPVIVLGGMLFSKVSYFVENPDVLKATLYNIDATVQDKYGVKIISSKNIANIQAMATNVLQQVLNESISAFGTVTMMYFFLYFMLININRLEASIVFYLPVKKDKIYMFGSELQSQTFSNAVGVPLIAVLQGLLGYGVYWFTGTPEPVFWGVITAFASIIPVVGTAVVWLPVAIFHFLQGQVWQGMVVLVWGAAVLGSADNVIRFMLAKRMADVHPVVTVLGVVVGLKYFNLPGLIFGPLLISYFIILIRIYYTEYQKPATAKRRKTIPVRLLNWPFGRSN